MIANIVLIFEIYIYIYDDDDDDDDVVIISPLSMCCLFSFFIHMFFIMYVIIYFYFTLRWLDEFCLKCFRNTGCQNLSSHELSFYKVFQEFVLRLDFIVFNK